VDNVEMGWFVQSFIQRLKEEREMDPEIDLLFVHEGETFVDCGVYTRNRCFRLWHSNKYGKDAPLTLSRKHADLKEGQKHDDDSEDSDDYGCKYKIGSKVDTFHELTLDAFAKSLVCARDDEEMGRSSYLRWDKPPDLPSPFHVGDHFGLSTHDGVTGIRCGDGIESPFPEIDRFLKEDVEFPPGVSRPIIRRWMWFETSNLLVCQLHGNRFCHRIGREHKSNNTQYVFDLRSGIYYQKCLDPDCRAVDYRSPWEKIPESILCSCDDHDVSETKSS
jgi:DNA-directed primase/polymerase protein